MHRLLLLLFIPQLAFASSAAHRQTLYNSIDPKSPIQHIALYQLYPNPLEGKRALQQACSLLTQDKVLNSPNTIPLYPLDVLVHLFAFQIKEHPPLLDEQTLQSIEQMSSHLTNRSLLGSTISNEEELLKLDPKEIDLARALLLLELNQDWPLIRSYEALIDLLALQILCHTTIDAPAHEKIKAINSFLFNDMDFHFPSHSSWDEQVDQYTFLPAVLDQHQGVCLGISILYLSIAQRIDLHLQAITPPGHIFLIYPSENPIHIETTARGVHFDEEVYYNANTQSLPFRNIREVIGMAFINQASVYWQSDKQDKVQECYSTAMRYLPNDPLITALLGYHTFIHGEKKQALSLLKQAQTLGHIETIAPDPILEDLLNQTLGKEGLAAIFLHTKDLRSSVEEKKETLLQAIEQSPKSKSLCLHLALTYLQLFRQKEALIWLEKYHTLDPNHPMVEEMLASVYLSRFHYPLAWKHLTLTEELIKDNRFPQSTQTIRNELINRSPNPKEMQNVKHLHKNR